MFCNPFDGQGEWYKANLHTHTTVSDGKASPEERVEQYRAQGYSVLAITDHNVSSEAAHLSTEDFLVVDGAELSPRDFTEGRGYHLACINTPPGRRWVNEGKYANELISEVRNAGGEVFIAHPYWCGDNILDLLMLQGYAAVEVFNSSCIDGGKADSTVHWDNMLELGLHVAAVAVDDTHSGLKGGSDLFAGYTMLKLSELSLAAVMDCLRNGRFYASCGPEFLDFRVEDGVARVRCSEVKEIRLMAWRYFGRVQRAERGSLLTEFEAPVGDRWRYVRAEIVDADDRHAWTNPILV